MTYNITQGHVTSMQLKIMTPELIVDFTFY